MQLTTETLSQVTNLLAIVTAPPIETSTIRHIEVLLLQPQLLMVVVITSTGGVTKRLFTFSEPVDPGLADWAASYLNERLVGFGLGARMLHQRLHDPSLSSAESGLHRRARAGVHRPRGRSYTRRCTSTARRGCLRDDRWRRRARS